METWYSRNPVNASSDIKVFPKITLLVSGSKARHSRNKAISKLPTRVKIKYKCYSFHPNSHWKGLCPTDYHMFLMRADQLYTQELSMHACAHNYVHSSTGISFTLSCTTPHHMLGMNWPFPIKEIANEYSYVRMCACNSTLLEIPWSYYFSVDMTSISTGFTPILHHITLFQCLDRGTMPASRKISKRSHPR